jgi:molecular chaperone GrpE
MKKKMKGKKTSQEEVLEETNTNTSTEEASAKKNEGKKDKGSESSQAETELKELKDKYLRLYAEFENYKRRTLKEKIDLMSSAAQDTMSALLPVLDDFDRAKKSAEAPDSKESFSEGVQLVYHKLYSILEQKGLRAMETNGEVFDPELHDAITEIPAPSDDLKGKVVDTIEKGYYLKEKIIRHAKVVVGM